jgi:ElaA protein
VEPGSIRVARFAELTPRELYAVLRLRVDAFVVEQGCAYPELDGRDLEPDALHCWVEDEEGPVAYLRILRDAGGDRIGRVVTAPRGRGRGHAGRLLSEALARCRRPVTIDAQAHLEAWYAGFGFRRDGEDFLEDGIWHVPMRVG